MLFDTSKIVFYFGVTRGTGERDKIDSMEAFSGVKAALIHGNELIAYLRDNKPNLNFANLWDFPGGGREGEETPFGCLRREVIEEFGIKIGQKQVIWQKTYPAMHDET